VNLRPFATTALVIISLYCDMLANPPHTVSIQIFEDNAVGGFQNTLPVILLVILLSALVLGIFSILKKEGLKLGW